MRLGKLVAMFLMNNRQRYLKTLAETARHLPSGVVVATDVLHVNTALSEFFYSIIVKDKSQLKPEVTC